MSSPILLLDVDGVLNALPEVKADLRAWNDWQFGNATADGARWPIIWSPSVVAALLDWHGRGLVELRWLTTWGHDANVELRLLLGLPELPVAGTHQDAGAPSEQVAAGAAHASIAPAAPDPLSGTWWKYDVVARLVHNEPGRRLIWVDDDLHRFNGAFTRWATEQPSVTPVRPDPRCGLSPADLEGIADTL